MNGPVKKHRIPPEILAAVRRIEIRTRRLVEEVFSGEYQSVFKGTGMEFREVREYVPGDDVRTIDWNVTATDGRSLRQDLRGRTRADGDPGRGHEPQRLVWFGTALQGGDRRRAVRGSGLRRHRQQGQGGPGPVQRPGGEIHTAGQGQESRPCA